MRCFAVLVGTVHDDSTVSLDVAGMLKQKSEQHFRHRPLRHLNGDLTSRESLAVLAIDSVGRSSGRDEVTSIRIHG